MSRTDKDTPWWMQAQWYEPVHRRCSTSHGHWFLYGDYRYGSGVRQPELRPVCDLPEDPLEKRDGRWWHFDRCHWRPVDRVYRWGATPAAKAEMKLWHRAVRREMNVLCHRSRWYQETGTDFTEPNHQFKAETHKHDWW